MQGVSPREDHSRCCRDGLGWDFAFVAAPHPVTGPPVRESPGCQGTGSFSTMRSAVTEGWFSSPTRVCKCTAQEVTGVPIQTRSRCVRMTALTLPAIAEDTRKGGYHEWAGMLPTGTPSAGQHYGGGARLHATGTQRDRSAHGNITGLKQRQMLLQLARMVGPVPASGRSLPPRGHPKSSAQPH